MYIWFIHSSQFLGLLKYFLSHILASVLWNRTPWLIPICSKKEDKISKMFKFPNQCFARLRFWKSVSDSQNLLDGATAVLLETLFQNRSRAKHWFKNLNILRALIKIKTKVEKGADAEPWNLSTTSLWLKYVYALFTCMLFTIHLLSFKIVNRKCQQEKC